MATASNKRKEKDLFDLRMHGHTVETIGDSTREFYVKFEGPKDSDYEGGFWRLRFTLPDAYPSEPPAIHFVNKIFHPNIQELTGRVCLNFLKQSWSLSIGLHHVVELFIPHLLLEPNPKDPFDIEAAALMIRDRVKYVLKVKEFVQQYAKREDAGFDSEKESEEEKETENVDRDQAGPV